MLKLKKNAIFQFFSSKSLFSQYLGVVFFSIFAFVQIGLFLTLGLPK